MSSQSLPNEHYKVGEPSCHNHYTRLSVRRSMSAFSGKGQTSNSSENLTPNPETEEKESLLSIYRRISTSSVGEVEGKAHSASKKNSRTRFSVFRRLSSVSSVGERQELNCGDFSGRKERVKRGSSKILAVQRRSNFLLDNDSCNGEEIGQLMGCNSYLRMDPSCFVQPCNRQQRTYGIWPCLIALGALIIIFLPLAKILDGLRSDICSLHDEIIDIKKQTGIQTTKSSEKLAKIPQEFSSAIKSLVQEELENFGSDKTGRTDFALETAGGRIVKVINTENYGSTVKLLGWTLCEGNNGPRALIQATAGPGECWAFKGSKGTILIKLLGKVRIDAVSLEHISRKISPTGKLDTAPKDFSIYGLEDLNKSKVPLGNFQYQTDSHPIQTFPIQKSHHEPFQFIEFHVESNHGSPEYTCVYRLRVHGTLESL